MRAITCSVHTDIGSRPVNEDSAGMFECGNRQLFVLCDGLGGHGMGDAASQLAVRVMGERFNARADADPHVVLQDAFLTAQKSLLSRQEELKAKRKMKTTAAALLSDGRKLYAAHVGDSRLYLFRKGKVMKRTLDHSVPQMLVFAGDIKENAIRRHPERSSLLKVLGIPWNQEQTEYMKPVPLRKVDAFLLCSDGFWELIEEDVMEATLSAASDCSDWLNRMAEIAKTNGQGQNMDNNSAIAGWISRR